MPVVMAATSDRIESPSLIVIIFGIDFVRHISSGSRPGLRAGPYYLAESLPYLIENSVIQHSYILFGQPEQHRALA